MWFKKSSKRRNGFNICEISCKPEWFYDKKVSIDRRFLKSRRKTNMKGGGGVSAPSACGKVLEKDSVN